MVSKKSYLKNIFALVISMLLVIQGIIISPTLAYAGNIITDSTNTYQYTFANNKATIVKYIGAQTPTINIPKEVDGVTVSIIGEEVFLNCTWLKNITLPNTLNNIGISAFENVGISQITIPGSVTNISGMAFYGCESLKVIYILHGIQTIGDGAFANCKNLDTIAIARSVSNMGPGTLRGNKTSILADSDTYAGSKYTPSGATVTKSDLPSDSPVPYEYGMAEDGSVIIKSYQGSNVNPEIPNEINGTPVKHIGDNAFNNEKGHNIETIKLPDSLLTIGSNAFAGTKLTSVIIPDSVTGIGEQAFDDKKDLILKGSCDALDIYVANMHNIVFVPYGPGATLYRKLTAVVTAGSGSVSGIKSGEYKKNAVVPVEAIPTSGYSFIVWNTNGAGSFDDVNKRMAKFTMPDANTAIGVSFGQLELFIEHGIVKAYDSTAPLSIPDTWEYEKFIDTRQVPTTRIQNITGSYYGHYNGGPITLEIPASITTIDDGVFYTSCYNLTDISVNDNNSNYSSEDGVLFNKDKTILIRYPSSKTGAEYTIPSSVETISPYAFYACNNLTTINIPDNLGKLKTIGNNAFDNSSITSITIPKNVSSIGSQAFYSCSRLTAINVDTNNANYMSDDGVLYNKNQSTLIVHPIARPSNTCIMPNTLKTIESYAFSSCSGLTTINIPNSVTTIGSNAFSDCTGLTSITIPNGVTTIGSSAFSSCTGLTSINIPASVSSFGSQALYNCSNLSSITVDDTSTYYYSDGKALYNKSKTTILVHAMATTGTEYSILDTVTNIASSAFSGCKQLNKIVLPSGLITIGSSAFSGCSSLNILSDDTTKARVLPDTVTNIGSWAFSGCSNLTDIDIPASVSNIESYAFSGCTKLTQAIIRRPKTQSLSMSYDIFNGIDKNNLTIKGYMESRSETYAYEYGIKFVPLDTFTTGLMVQNGVLVGYTGTDTDIILSDDIHTIGSKAFSNPSNKNTVITSITMPLSVKKFEDYALNDCILLDKITIPRSVNDISKSAFKGCSNLEQIKVDTANTTYADINGVLTNKDKTTIKEVPDAFKGINKDGKYTVPSSITSIESSAFADCSGITDLTIKDMKHIAINAFKGAFVEPSVIKVNLLGNIDDIDDGAFADCTGITSITIPNTVTRIGNDVFAGCTKLTDINITSGNVNALYASYDGVLFTNKDKETSKFNKQLIRYPIGKASTESAPYEIPNDTVAIHTNAFKDAVNLKGVIIPDSIDTIGAHAFDGCTFATITIPGGVSTIKEQAFANNNSIIEIELPNTVSTVEQGAFINCSKFITAKIYRNDIDLQGQVFDEKEVSGKPFVTIHAFPGSNGYLYTTTHANIGFISLIRSAMQANPDGVVGENINLNVTPDKNNHAQANVTEEQITAAMGNAITSLKDTININISTVSEMVYSIDTTIPKNSITLLAKDTKANNLAINTPVANIKFVKSILNIISTNAISNDIVVSAKMVDISTLPQDIKNQVKENTVFKLSISSGGNEITDFEGNKISVVIPYTLSENQIAENIKLYYLNNIGELTEINSIYSSGYVSFEADTFDNMYIVK